MAGLEIQRGKELRWGKGGKGKQGDGDNPEKPKAGNFIIAMITHQESKRCPTALSGDCIKHLSPQQTC